MGQFFGEVSYNSGTAPFENPDEGIGVRPTGETTALPTRRGALAPASTALCNQELLALPLPVNPLGSLAGLGLTRTIHAWLTFSATNIRGCLLNEH